MSWNVMIVTGIDLLWDLRIDLKYRCGPRVAEHDSWVSVLSNTICAIRYLAIRYLTLPAIF